MKKILFLWAALSLLLAGGCVKEPGEPDPLRSGKLRLQVSVDELTFDGGGDPTRAALTRSTVEAETGEDQIGSLYLLFFRADGLRQGQFVDYVRVELEDDYVDMNVQTRMADIDTSGTLIDPAEAYHILAVANISDSRYLDEGVDAAGWLSAFTGMTEEQAVLYARGRVTAGQTIEPYDLLMNGRIEKAAGQNQLNLTLSRNKVRLDVVNNTREVYDLVTATVWNAYPTTSIWPGEVLMDYSSSAARIRRHYGVDNSLNETSPGNDGQGNLLGDIHGGLYVFENQVVSPAGNDNATTCLIVGLTRRGESKPTYYRANIVLDGTSQYLRRNHVYALTIRSVSGPGAATEELAYLGQGNTIEYTIGWWNIDDNGLIVKDDYSILSIPTKVVNIGRDASTSNFSIYTFSSLPSPAPLAIRNQTYTPVDGGIRARLDGNTLVIEADPLAYDQSERRGVIVLSFAGLETSLTVIQSGTADDYLRVYLPDGGIPQFQAFGGIPSGLIRVEATGPWTARLYMSGFSFGSVPNSTPITTLPSSSGLVVENRFRVYTNSLNETGRARDAFIVVSLDKDPDNYQSLVRVSQAASGAIKLEPEDQTTVTFDGAGQLAVIPGMSNTNVFTVTTGAENWTASIISEGIYTDSGHFEVVTDGNKVTVTAKGLNTYGRTLSAILRISGTDGAYTDIILFQQPANIALIPASLSAVPAAGGQTALVRVDAPGTVNWSAVLKPVDGSATDGRKLVRHEAKLVDQNGTAIVAGTNYPTSTQFRVVFPKVYYPNREIPIAVDVEVTVAGVKQTIRATQTALTARSVSPSNTVSMYAGYASIGSSHSYFDYYRNMLTNSTVFGSGKKVPVGPLSSLNSVTTLGSEKSIGNNVNYLHFNMAEISNTNTMYGHINTWRAAIEGVWVICADISSEKLNSLFYGNGTYTAADSPFNKWRISTSGDVDDDSNRRTLCSDNTANTRIGQFLTTRGAYPISSSAGLTYFANGVSAAANISAKTADSKAVRIIGTSNDAVGMFIDPANRVVYIGEAEFFHSTTASSKYSNTTGTPLKDHDKFLANVVAYVFYTAAYGSHFSDLLVDDPTLPAPWDEQWGANRMNQ